MLTCSFLLIQIEKITKIKWKILFYSQLKIVIMVQFYRNKKSSALFIIKYHKTMLIYITILK